MRRRQFITLLGGAAASCASWPLAARAQERMRRVGVLWAGANDDADQLSRLRVFHDALRELGWTDGRNMQTENRWAAGSAERFRAYAAELVGLKPDVILADASPSTGALQRQTRIVPIVFARVSDPIGQGFVANMAQPGGNITGFTNYEPAMGGKWVELLKEAAPGIRRIALVYNPQTAPYTLTFLPAFETAARAHAVTLVNTPVHDGGELQSAIAAQSSEPGGGIILQTDSFLYVHRDLIAASATRHRLPTIGPTRAFPASGCLISYAVDVSSMYRGAATYVDRIFKGTRPADLPVQGPTKFELVINLKTAKALGIEMPPTLLGRADEVIE